MTQDQINAIADEIVREGMDLVREAASEVLEACRPVEHVRPVNEDRVAQYLRGRRV